MRAAAIQLAALTCALVTSTLSATLARAAEQKTTDLGRVLSRAESDTRPIMRDGGISVQYSTQPPKSLWLFGDTSQSHGPQFLGGTTAATSSVASASAPTDLLEVPTPPAVGSSVSSPQPFFPVPVGLAAPGSGLPCGTPGSDSLYPAAWPAGGARIPGSSMLLLVYLQVCVTGKSFPTERLTLTLYDAQKNQFTGAYTPYVAEPLASGLAERQRLQSPVFADDGYLYLFACDRQHIWVARVAADSVLWGKASNYRWWSHERGHEGVWTPNESAATSIVTGLSSVYGVSVGDYSHTSLHKYVLLIQTGFRAGNFALFEASTPQGPWTAGPAGRVPDSCKVGVFGCYALYGHPELSTHELLVYSWFSPGASLSSGRVRVGSVRW